MTEEQIAERAKEIFEYVDAKERELDLSKEDISRIREIILSSPDIQALGNAMDMFSAAYEQMRGRLN